MFASLRYFSYENHGADLRPGLPKGVSALVEKITQGQIQVQFYNLTGILQNFLIQGGCFAEHKILNASVLEENGSTEKTIEVNGTYLAISLHPGSGLTLILSVQRFSQKPSYLLPGMGFDGVPETILPRQREE